MITITQFLGEMLGSFTLIAMGVGISMNLNLRKSLGEGNTATISGPLAWGFAVAMAVTVAMPFESGGHFNPAISIAFAAAGKFDWALVPGYILAQTLGSFLGALASWFVYGKQFEATADEPKKMLTVFATAPGVRNSLRNFSSEALATFFLVFISLLMLPAQLIIDGREVPLGLGANGALVNGFMIFAIGMSFGGVTSWSLNPTRDLMPRLVHQLMPIKGKGNSDWGYGFKIATMGPIVGGLLGAIIYLVVKPYFF